MLVEFVRKRMINCKCIFLTLPFQGRSWQLSRFLNHSPAALIVWASYRARQIGCVFQVVEVILRRDLSYWFAGKSHVSTMKCPLEANPRNAVASNRCSIASDNISLATHSVPYPANNTIVQ